MTARLRALRRSTLALAVLLAGAIAAVGSWEAPATAVACSSGQSVSNALGPATGWTEFVEGNGRRGAESEGAIAYGGDHAAGGMTVGTRLSAGYPADAAALVVAGTHGTYNLQRGSAYLSPKSGVNFNGGPGTGYLASNPIAFPAAFATLRALSAEWAAASATGTVAEGIAGGNTALVFSGDSASLNVFELTPAQVSALASGVHVRYDVPAGSTTIINVPGTSVGIAGQMWTGPNQQANDATMAAHPGIVWNFPAATSVTLNYGSAWGGHILAPVAEVTVASVGHTIGQVIAKGFVSNYETHQNLFPSQACVPGTPSPPGTSDVTVLKSASTATPRGGDTVTYTVQATNLGDATATGVVIRDELPAGVSYLAASGSCARSAGVVTCPVGSLAPGASTAVTITVLVDPIAGTGAGAHPRATHWLTPYKAEAQVDLAPGQQRTVTLGCAGGGFLSDGQFRVDHVDQGTGTIRDVRILSARSADASTWKGVIRNDATGRAQAKAFIVCLSSRTEAHGHRHPLAVDAAVPSLTRSYGVGRWSATLTCPTGTVAVAPGFDLSSAGAELVGSEQISEEPVSGSPRQWVFTLEVTAPVTATFTTRCLRTTVDAVKGHTHQLRFTHVVRTVTVPAHTAPQGDEHQVVCPDDAKGVVATFELPPGVHHVGNDPRLKARAFRLFNDSGVARDATIDLVCLHDRTGREKRGTPRPVEVVNTATVSSTSADANPDNNAGSTTLTVRPGKATAAVLGLRVARARVAVTVLSSMPGRGALRVKAGGKVLARGKAKLRPGRTVVAKLKVTKKAQRKLKRARSVRVIVKPARGKKVAKVVRSRR